MRTSIKKTGLFAAMAAFAITAFAQGIQPDLQYYRLPGYDGLNVFETGKKNNDVSFDGFKIRVGGDFALQYQLIKQEANMTNSPYSMKLLGNSVNLPTANLNIDAQLADGMRVHLRSYLSARHHNEAWVKGGYIQIDRLDFIKEGFAEGVMDIFTLKAGVDNFSYGDAVFRRSDNAMAIYNPFVGNYLMDNNTVEPFMEVQAFPGNFIVIGGIGTGILNPTVLRSPDNSTTATDDYVKVKPSFWVKAGWDNQINDDLRVRLTASLYNSSDWNQGYRLYAGDRAGARYYNVLTFTDSTNATYANDFSGRIDPNFRQLMAIQVNPFVKYQGFEFFGVFERAMGNASGAENPKGSEVWEAGNYTQLGAELIYRFGAWDQFFVGGRYNTVTGNNAYASVNEAGVAQDAPEALTVSRLNVGAGWFFTRNVLVKLEYVNQSYDDNWSILTNRGAPVEYRKGATFDGIVLEAVIGF